MGKRPADLDTFTWLQSSPSLRPFSVMIRTAIPFEVRGTASHYEISCYSVFRTSGLELDTSTLSIPSDIPSMVSTNTNNGFRLLFAIAAAAIYFVAKQHIAGMDNRLFQYSVQGIKAAFYYQLGDLNGAASAYRSHFKARHEAGHHEYDQVNSALLAGESNQAKKLALDALAKHPDSLRAVLTLGEVALDEQQFSEALARANHVLQRETDEANALLLVSLTYAQLREYDKAIDAVNRALRHGRIADRDSLFFALLETTGHLEDLPRTTRPLAVVAHYYRYLRVY